MTDDQQLCGHCRPPVDLHGACLEPDCSCPCNQDVDDQAQRRAIHDAISEILQQAVLWRDVDPDQVEPLTDAIYNEVLGVLDPGTLPVTKKVVEPPAGETEGSEEDSTQ